MGIIHKSRDLSLILSIYFALYISIIFTPQASCGETESVWLILDYSNGSFEKTSEGNPNDESVSLLFMEDENGEDVNIGALKDNTPRDGGDRHDGWTTHRFNITELAKDKGPGVYHFKWKFMEGNSAGHVRNFRIKIGDMEFFDKDRGAGGDHAVDGRGEAGDGGEYVDHYVELPSEIFTRDESVGQV